MPLQDRASPLRIGVLSVDERWREQASMAAERLGSETPATLDCEGQAVMWLATAPSGLACLLAEPSMIDGHLPELVALTLDASEGDGCLVMLGRSAPGLEGIPCVTSPDADQIAMVVTSALQTPPRGNAGLSAPALREALRAERMQARYQPIVRLADQHPVGFEALARLAAADGRSLAADLFVPIIEDAGLAPELTAAIAARAFAERAVLATEFQLSINLSLDVLLIPAALQRLEAQREAARVAATRCIVELTESRPVADFAALARAVEALRRIGYGVAIDDLGPDVPQQEALLELPFSALKLAFETVGACLVDDEANDYLARTIALGRSKGMTIVAEGVESPAIWKRVQALGAEHGQGFMIGRPLPAGALPVWLERWPLDRVTTVP